MICNDCFLKFDEGELAAKDQSPGVEPEYNCCPDCGSENVSEYDEAYDEAADDKRERI